MEEVGCVALARGLRERWHIISSLLTTFIFFLFYRFSGRTVAYEAVGIMYLRDLECALSLAIDSGSSINLRTTFDNVLGISRIQEIAKYSGNAQAIAENSMSFGNKSTDSFPTKGVLGKEPFDSFQGNIKERTF